MNEHPRRTRRQRRAGPLAAMLAGAALLAAACGGSPRTSPPSPSPGLTREAARFAACMRSHGIKNFPTPTVSGGGIGVRVPASLGITRNSPQLQSAQHACQPLLSDESAP